jgi:hypothetical protein
MATADAGSVFWAVGVEDAVSGELSAVINGDGVGVAVGSGTAVGISAEGMVVSCVAGSVIAVAGRGAVGLNVLGMFSQAPRKSMPTRAMTSRMYLGTKPSPLWRVPVISIPDGVGNLVTTIRQSIVWVITAVNEIGSLAKSRGQNREVTAKG